VFSRWSFVLLSFIFWPLCCLFFFDIRTMITPLDSSNSSYMVHESIQLLDCLQQRRQQPKLDHIYNRYIASLLWKCTVPLDTFQMEREHLHVQVFDHDIVNMVTQEFDRRETESINILLDISAVAEIYQ